VKDRRHFFPTDPHTIRSLLAKIYLSKISIFSTYLICLKMYEDSTHASQSLDLSLRYFTTFDHPIFYPRLITERPDQLTPVSLSHISIKGLRVFRTLSCYSQCA